MGDKKDLTSLNDLFPTTTGTETEGAPGTSTLDFSAPPPLEGLDELLEPMAPFDPMAGVPPLDPEVERLAAGASEDLPPSPLESASPLEEPEAALLETVEPALVPDETQDVAPTTPSAPAPGMNELRDYSERLAPSSSAAAAATPFSLLIEGALKTHEREALIQILTRESLGIREVELEPQFQAGRILIPRISEYAGVLIVQTLRNTNAKMRLGPSEKIFVSKDADDGDSLIFGNDPDAELLLTEEGESPADRIPIVPENTVPSRRTGETLDTLIVSMNLKAAHVAHAQSPVFQDAIEKLKRQLKFQAHHRGADALVSFKYELHPLEGQTVYKLVVQATAVRLETRDP